MATFPSLHLNGSSAESLIEGYEKAGQALMIALNTVAETAPNARDYYVQGEHATRQAVKEHEARLARIRMTRDEIAALHEHILNDAEERG